MMMIFKLMNGGMSGRHLMCFSKAILGVGVSVLRGVMTSSGRATPDPLLPRQVALKRTLYMSQEQKHNLRKCFISLAQVKPAFDHISSAYLQCPVRAVPWVGLRQQPSQMLAHFLPTSAAEMMPGAWRQWQASCCQH
eukprot:1159197-Pelagomonas_calceolata.AAC.9